ncbi:MAG: hypothetical protein IKU72_00355 [Oscillospiraceae bacterium]|nr:hypothetical protein [Oscillospiraceae bacterium]
MKKLSILPLALILMYAISFPVFAADETSYERQMLLNSIDENEIIQALPKQVQDELKALDLDSIDPQRLMNLNPQDIFQYTIKLLKEQLAKPLKAFTRVSGAMILLAFLKGLHTTADQNKGVVQMLEVVSALVICSSFVRPVIGCIASSSSAIADCSDFILSFLPVYSGVLIACGQAATASTTHVFLFWMCQITSRFASETLVPLIGFYLALCLVGSILQRKDVMGIASAIKSVLGWTLGLSMTLFVGTLSLSSIVSAVGDNLGTRTARFLLGSFVPVVGGALSEAFTTAQSCLQLIKSSIGVYGVIASGIIFLPTVIQMILWYFSVNLSSVAAQLFGLDGIVSLLKSIGSALGILLALLLSFMLLLMVSVTLILLVGQVVH